MKRDGGVVVFKEEEMKRIEGWEGRIWEIKKDEENEMNIGGKEENVKKIRKMIDMVEGRVKIVIEMKGIEGRDEGLVEEVEKEI